MAYNLSLYPSAVRPVSHCPDHLPAKHTLPPPDARRGSSPETHVRQLALGQPYLLEGPKG